MASGCVDVDVDIGICAYLGCCCCSSGLRCGDMLLDVVSSTRMAPAILWVCCVHGGSPTSTMYSRGGAVRDIVMLTVVKCQNGLQGEERRT